MKATLILLAAVLSFNLLSAVLDLKSESLASVVSMKVEAFKVGTCPLKYRACRNMAGNRQ